MINDSVDQRTLDWYRQRWACITGSKVSVIMAKGRKKDEVFGQTAKSYLYQIAAERAFNQDFLNDDEVFQDYIDLIQLHSKAVEWGQEQEKNAKDLFMKLCHPGKELLEVASCPHDTIPHFAASPDGLIRQAEEDGSMRVVEVKCPAIGTFMQYKAEIHDAESLKATKPEYYWQVMSEMACTGCKNADFVVYCPWLQDPLHVALIKRNDDDIKALEERVILANEFIDNIINPKKEEVK